MGRILWVNPVCTPYFDEEARSMIEAVRAPHHVPRVRHIDGGPPHLEYHLHEHDAFAPMLELMREAQADGCAAGVIGCFYDGGLRAAVPIARVIYLEPDVYRPKGTAEPLTEAIIIRAAD